MNSHSVYTDGQMMRMPLGLIKVKEGFNPRRFRSEKDFNELCDSVGNHGVEQSITVSPCSSESNDVFVVAGEGRYLAAEKHNLSDIPVHIKLVTQREALAIAMRENSTRENMSIPDEALAAQKAVSFCEGDREEAGKLLDWSKSKIDSRLLLCKCSVKVLDAVNSKSIRIGHAELLSQLTIEMQEGTLEKCISEKWSVPDLKERAIKVAQDLNKAIFDKEGCATCHHNSSMQQGLFDESLGEARCCNFDCYQSKTKETIEALKVSKADSYASVFLDIEKPLSDRVDVCVENVGESQYIECQKCAKFGCVIYTDAEKLGGCSDKQCFDLECYEKVFSLNNEIKSCSDSSEQLTEGAEQAVPKQTTNTKKAEKKKTSVMPNSVQEQHNKFIREIAAENLSKDHHAAFALMATLVLHYTSLNNYDFMKKLNISRTASLDEKFTSLLSSSVDDLSSISRQLICSSIKDGSFTSAISSTMEKLAAQFLVKKQPEKYSALLGEKWMPTEELLKGMTIPMIVGFLEDSGFDKWLDAKLEGAFASFKKQKKKDMVKAVLKSDYGFEGYCPQGVLTLVDKHTGKGA